MGRILALRPFQLLYYNFIKFYTITFFETVYFAIIIRKEGVPLNQRM